MRGSGSGSSTRRPWQNCRPSCPRPRWPEPEAPPPEKSPKASPPREKPSCGSGPCDSIFWRSINVRRRNGSRSSSSLACRDCGAGPARDEAVPRPRSRYHSVREPGPAANAESRNPRGRRSRSSTFLRKSLHGGRSSQAGNDTAGPRVQVLAGLGSLGSLRADPELAIAARTGTGAPGLARDSRSTAVGVRTGGGRERGPGTDPRAETGRTRGDRAPTPRPGRATGEGVERVSDPARGGSPLARRGLGTRSSESGSRIPVRPSPITTAMPRSGPAEGCPGHSVRTPAPWSRPDRPRPIPDPNHPVAQAILRQFQTLCSDVRRNAEERRDSRSEGRRPES